ncbi:acyltransferase [Jiangella aurantiaca]|uniref:acyltransferase n=1 Tax=Jiangella aurantiaca TaxID=2530373 RepID=UPI00193E5B83|nr:hypothetical protein [Jiangella aurantiaca]
MDRLPDGELDFLPWLFWSRATDEQRDGQQAWQQELRSRGLERAGERSFVSYLAAVYEAELTVGHDSFIAAHVYLTSDVDLGDHSRLNPYAVVRGPVRIGDGVRIGAREQAGSLLDRYWTDAFVNQPGGAPTVRATCDAVEIADLLLGGPPPQEPARELTRRLAARQDPGAGLIPELGETTPLGLDGPSAYHVLCVGCSLDRHGPQATQLGWLMTRRDRWSGLWGMPSVHEGRRQPVNGSYRLTRGTFAQFGVNVPRPEATIDTVLPHAQDGRFFAEGRGTACDVLDVVHPLWLCGQQTRHRRPEVQNWVGERLDSTLSRWHPEAGFPFSPAPTTRSEHQPSGALGYRPRGVHRPEPAWPGEVP